MQNNETYFQPITPDLRARNEEIQLMRDTLSELRKLNALLSASSVTLSGKKSKSDESVQ